MSEQQIQMLQETKTLMHSLLSDFKSELVKSIKAELSVMPPFSRDQVNSDTLIRPAEAARRMGISTKTLTRWRDKGLINHVRRNNCCLYFENEVSEISNGTKSIDLPVESLVSIQTMKAGRKPKFNL